MAIITLILQPFGLYKDGDFSYVLIFVCPLVIIVPIMASLCFDLI